MSVYVFQKSGSYDFAPAAEYGDLIFLTDESASIKQVQADRRGMFEEYDPEEDHLIVNGSWHVNHLLTQEFAAEMAARDNLPEEYSVLVYNKSTEEYSVAYLPFDFLFEQE